jgi:hypothetical protein
MSHHLARVLGLTSQIQQHLETLVSRAQTISTLAVLRILNMTHSMCSALIDDLKTFDTTLVPLIAGPTADVQVSGPVMAMLEHAVEEIFVPWLEGTRYLESESKNLVELYAGLLSRFTRYHVSRVDMSGTHELNMQETVLKAKPNSLLDKVVLQLSNSSSAATSSSTAQAAAAAISKYANVFTSASGRASPSAGNPAKGVLSPTLQTRSALPAHMAIGNGTSSPTPRSGAITPVGGRTGLQRSDSVKGELVNKELEEKVWATDGVLTVEMAERMLKWHAEAVGRVVELTPPTEVSVISYSRSYFTG